MRHRTGRSRRASFTVRSRSGTASALNGFLMMVAAFAMGGWLGAHMDGTVFPMVYGIWFWSVLITLSAWTLVQRHGHTPRH